MVDQEMLLAISEMMDVKLQVMSDNVDAKLQAMSDNVDAKLQTMSISVDERMLFMSEMMDAKLRPIHERLERIEMRQENDILPRLQNIESCYVSTYERYISKMEEVDALKMDMEIVKRIIPEHSRLLQKLA